MPNWCTNDVIIAGSVDDIAKLKALIGDDFAFNKIIPMPEEFDENGVGQTGCNVMVVCDPKTMLCHEASGKHGGRDIMEVVNARLNESSDIIPLVKAVIDDYVPCEECLNITVKQGKLGQGLDFPLEESIKRFKEHGCDNWYDWRRKHWGTKWDASDVQSDFGPMPNSNSLGETASFTFTTAWSPPEPIYHALCKLFPNLDIKWHWGEPGCGCSGDLDTGETYDYKCDCDDEECWYCHPENIEEPEDEAEEEPED
jgi:hypothetical protein